MYNVQKLSQKSMSPIKEEPRTESPVKKDGKGEDGAEGGGYP